MANNSKPAAKKGLSLTAELAAYSLSREAPNLDGRRPVKGFAIDSADPTDPMDRDDAISVEYRNDPVRGRLTILHVTIADVASVVPRNASREPSPKLAALDTLARGMGQTKYFAHGSNPMFPRRLQDCMSLEHHQERPGITISVTYDDKCNRIHTELSRSRIKTTCKSYRQASADITDASTTGNPLQRISILAKSLMARKPGEVKLPYYDEASGTYMDTEGQLRHVSQEASSSYLAVQGCMIAANEAVAEMMRDSNFMFRNHYESADGQALPFREGARVSSRALAKAEYGDSCLGHYGLGSAHYAHVTSPIRRYSDLVNQRMEHWAIDVVEAVRDAAMTELAGKPGALTQEQLQHRIWGQGRELIGRVTAFKESGRGRGRIEAQRALETRLTEMLRPAFAADGALLRMAVASSLEKLDKLELPYTKKEVAQVAAELNEMQRKTGPTRSYDEMMNATLDSIFRPQLSAEEEGFRPDPEHVEEAVRKRRPYKFADLLEAAARRGDNNDFFAAEVLRRLKSEDDRVELVRNLHTLLVVPEKGSDSRWTKLKWDAFEMIKDDPMLAERVLAYAQHDEHNIHMAESTQIANGGTIPRAQVVLTNEGEDYAMPFDTGDTPEAARRGAILTFFRHYGELSPRGELITHKLIELALVRARLKKGERMAALKKLCGSELSVEELVAPLPGEPEKAHIMLRVKLKGHGDMLEKTRSGWTEFKDEYLDKCARDVIEDRRFGDMLSACELQQVMESQKEVPVSAAQREEARATRQEEFRPPM